MMLLYGSLGYNVLGVALAMAGWINPLMAMYFAFDLHAVAQANLYLKDLEGCQGVWDVQLRIEAARHKIPRRPGPTTIPV